MPAGSSAAPSKRSPIIPPVPLDLSDLDLEGGFSADFALAEGVLQVTFGSVARVFEGSRWTSRAGVETRF